MILAVWRDDDRESKGGGLVDQNLMACMEYWHSDELLDIFDYQNPEAGFCISLDLSYSRIW